MKKDAKGRTIEMTEAEARDFYDRNNWADVMCFEEFISILAQDGTAVVKEGKNDAEN